MRIFAILVAHALSCLARGTQTFPADVGPISYGNHRYVLRPPPGSSSAPAFTAEIVWRRSGSDENVSNTLVIFHSPDANLGFLNLSGVPVPQLVNATVLNASRHNAYVAVDARAMPEGGLVYAYFLPFKRGSKIFNENVYYLTANKSNASAPWRKEVLDLLPSLPHLSSAQVLYEARDSFNAFTELERTATKEEIQSMLSKHTDVALLFPEPRERVIRMTWRYPTAPGFPDLSYKWAQTGPQSTLDAGQFSRGEFATFQIGLFAARGDITDISIVLITAFESKTGGSIPASAVNCFNLQGFDNHGSAFNRNYSVPALQSGALWFGVDIPSSVQAGVYSSNVTLSLDGVKHSVVVSFVVDAGLVPNHGDANISKLTRTRWINSRVGIDDEPAKRFSPLLLDRSAARLSNWHMDLDLAPTGLPRELRQRKEGQSLLSGVQMQFGGAEEEWQCNPLSWMTVTHDIVSWIANCSSAHRSLQMDVFGSFEADGTLLYTIGLKSNRDTVIDGVQLKLPFNVSAVPYFMGLGKSGGKRVPWNWRWWAGHSTALNNNLFWLGDVKHGLRVKFLGDGEEWLGGMHYIKDDRDIPASWGGTPQHGQSVHAGGGSCIAPNCTLYSGGVNISEPDAAGIVWATAYRGTRTTLSSSEPLTFKLEMLATPSAKLNTSSHFGVQGRYYQLSMPAVAPMPFNASYFLDRGIKVLNVHQGVPVLNPYINYPFEPEATEPLSELTEAMHAGGGRLKLYYTTRELSNHAEEVWLLRALGDEILDKPGGVYRNLRGGLGASWLQEHLHSNYSPCWSTPSLNVSADGMMDTAICDGAAHSPTQRWGNYYVAGLQWLVSQAPHIDGMYLDGVAYDRITMKRCRKVMDAVKDSCLIDMHSGNNIAPEWGRVSPALQYMHLMPYMDSLMLGEGYQAGYDKPADVDGGGPEWYLLEVSGIPIGLMNDMLGQGQPWRGMVFGMVTRLPYPGGALNGDLWKFWDTYQLSGCVMRGWWEHDPAPPVVMSAPKAPRAGTQSAVQACGSSILATSFVLTGNHTVIAAASWANETVTCDLVVDWQAIGLSASVVGSAHAPLIPGFQTKSSFPIDADSQKILGVPFASARGWLLILAHQPALYV